jgi:hypothetical protein
MPATWVLSTASLTMPHRSNATKVNHAVKNAQALDGNVMATFSLRLGGPGTRSPSSAQIDRQSLREVYLCFLSRLPQASCERWNIFV